MIFNKMNINTYEGFCSHLLVSRETYEKFTIFNNTLVKWQSSINLISNSTIENIGARRLHTILERVLEDISFSAADKGGEKITIDANYVKDNVNELSKDTDLSKFIL